jgi:pimeloyl-ACP methyl ester carboxylesterase
MLRTFAIVSLLAILDPSVSAGAEFDWRAVLEQNQALPPGAINDHEAVKIGGIQQWISVRGADPANPLLLYLHGGPGSPMLAESWTFQRPWEDFFTVVQWDQRGAGKTFAANGGKLAGKLSIEQMQADAEELIEYLLRRYHQRRIFLLGHSWGSVLGVRVALHRPDLLHAYIGVGQVVNMRRNEAVGYELTLKEARRDGNAKAIEQLVGIAPYPGTEGPLSFEKTAVERQWDRYYRGMIYALRDDDEDGRRRMSSLYSESDLAAAERGEEETVKALWPQLASVDFDPVRRLDCPFFLFAGTQDRTTPTAIAKAFYDQVQARGGKRYFEIPNAAHYVLSEAPGVVLVDLVQYVRPVAK